MNLLHSNKTIWPFRGHFSKWTALFVLSICFVGLLELAHLSAALLLGPMLAAVTMALCDRPVRLPPPIFMSAQAIVGCMIATSMPRSLAHEILRDWPMFFTTVASVLVASAGIGWTLARLQVLPGTVAVWGSLPGAASAMALMAETFGADGRVVAFMQYTRVLLTAVVASAVAKLWGVHIAPQPEAHALRILFPPVTWGAFGETLLLAGSAAWLGWRLRVPAGPLIVPMLFGVVFQDAGWIHIELPRWLLVFAYAMVGWGIGMRFTRDIVKYVAAAFPRVLLSTLALIGLCGLLAFALSKYAHVDPLTAYLATSPGGADSVAIIASSTPVNVSFVMALQTARFLMVLVIGPTLARWIAQRVDAVLETPSNDERASPDRLPGSSAYMEAVDDPVLRHQAEVVTDRDSAI